MVSSLFDNLEIATANVFPSTRYQGSKAKFVDWISRELSGLRYNTVLDAFGGTGSVAYKFKDIGKKVVYNDILPFNAMIGKALIENNGTLLTPDEVDDIVRVHNTVYPSFIADNFHDIYYTDEENLWLDRVVSNIRGIGDEYKQAIAWFALFQACIIKRPYNLFHRKNLYVRQAVTPRSFGNKTTWDTPFEVHFRHFVEEANLAVFNNGQRCEAWNKDAADINDDFDLVYIDTPYLNSKGIGVDYADFYHFLNGMLDYEHWGEKIDYASKHRRMKRSYSVWTDKNRIMDGFETLIENYGKSILVFSYRSNGIPSINELAALLKGKGRDCVIRQSSEIKYVLSNSKSQEVLLISCPKS